MRKKIFIAFILLIAVFVSSCSPGENLSTETEYGGAKGILANNDVVDFYFYYPPDFTLDKNAAMISVYIGDQEIVRTDITGSVDPTAESGASDNTYAIAVNPNISATVFTLSDNSGGTPQEYWDITALPMLERTFADFKLIATEDAVVDECEAKIFTYEGNIAGIAYKYAQAVFVNKGQVYTLTYTSSPAKFEDYSSALEMAVNTFKFKQ
ncbi:hypothetical protein FACS1894219_07600 [Clostridia bacterium]|nr:hypothetical protein FACS1894219_07600 [Clostridia bacterium]